jgi:uracil-DNA glycosylase
MKPLVIHSLQTAVRTHRRQRRSRELHSEATVHPSSILRAPGDEARRFERARFVEDLKTIAAVIHAARET